MENFFNSLINTASWVGQLITFQTPWYQNYFWGLLVISLLVWGLEILFPWRKNQSIIRRDFWMDAFYMFFNFFLFSIFISGFYSLAQAGFESIGVTMNQFTLINLESLPSWLQLFLFFILLDFVQWLTHVMLHKVPLFWNFHKVHHSVKEMGFAAHLRYHWMENILYKPLKTLAVMILGGFEPQQAYIIHFLTISLGHLNHANIKLSYGPLKYIFNNPVMHLYHHAYHLPRGKFGVNFAISLSFWDYLFKTNYIPEDSGTIELGFEGEEHFPKNFWEQAVSGFRNNQS